MNLKPNKKARKIIKWVLWVLLIQLVLVNISASLYAYKLTHFYSEAASDQPASRNVLVRTWKIFTGPRFARTAAGSEPSFPIEEIVLERDNGGRVHGWLSIADSATAGTVIMCHGVMAQKSQMAAEAAGFRSMGLNVLMLDFRGHGRSDGRTTTLGVDETEEIKLAWDHLVARGEKRIFLYGISMGAVAIARAVWAFDLKPAGMIMEMPFESLRSHLRARARTMGFPGFPEKPFAFLVSNWIGWQRGFNGMKHKTTKYVKSIGCPILIQWGDKDEFVLRSEVENIFNAVNSSRKKLVIYPGAGHQSLLISDEVKWGEEVRFLVNAR